MSGIVGHVGARSGVLGTTEIDYEEGTWTPVMKTGVSLSPSWSNTISFSGGTQTFIYTRIGNLVHAHFSADNSTTAASGSMGTECRIEGLPFATSYSATWFNGTPLIVSNSGLDFPAHSHFNAASSSSIAYLLGWSNGHYDWPTPSNPGANTYLSFQITYII